MKRPTIVKSIKLLKVNLGNQPVEGFEKLAFDALKFPWPLKDGNVEELIAPMCFNYVHQDSRGTYMDEAYRVLVPEGKFHVWVPYYTSMRAVQDYATLWPPFCEASFLYFNRDWRKVNHPERNLKCNFDFTFGYQAQPETATKNEETRAFWIKHYANAVDDLRVVLTKKP